ncbi:hypothetical protein HMPREF9582_00022 [Cutibacterium acnes HL060PA1]|nr:hypothetical protein HMPREF9603_02538 [Cutibacterium acnes HL001PA1]EFT10009.1 hypothetical protein HMPREF9619_01471 [Cutibacterium acnes HL082PA2]EFT24777.1 hypothetical protein HMPREF9577_02639 [Cutibacterium acnes HL110PA3]EFT62987.1 hypothetical protein HMPREF9578_01309 [Cutibacterium acnes HL110PA4]EFT67114.1 hypothetical protein HMPREF9582_00022 [Cutibacterium acnes HL060PA1]EGE70528.1 hypothetical protein HMPREF9341_00236 [Cutibacterium acnes HL103PA1]TLF88163.1 sodium:solute sympor
MAWGVCDINGSFAGQNPVTTRLSVRRCQWRCVDFAHSKCLRTQNYRVQMRSCRTGVYGSPRGDANEAVPPPAPTERTTPHHAVGDTHQRRVR